MEEPWKNNLRNDNFPESPHQHSKQSWMNLIAKIEKLLPRTGDIRVRKKIKRIKNRIKSHTRKNEKRGHHR